MGDKIVNLNIAEIVVTKDPVVVCTVLGSCVSVCLFSEEDQAGGIIHYALPHLSEGQHDNLLRYGDQAIKILVDELCKITGQSAEAFSAKIVGGANNIASEHPAQKIGEANVKIARKLLAQYGIKIVGEDVGGVQGRKILFHIQTGRLQSAFVGAGFSRPSAEKAIQLPNTLAKPSTKKRVLIVDDSKTIRDLLCRIIQQDPHLEVVGQAEDPLKAELLLHKVKPDVITLDVHMPIMTGVQWLRKLLPKYPIPVVMITSLGFQEGNEVFQALELGAVDYIQKPALNEINSVSPIIREKIHNAADAKVRVGASNLASRPVFSEISYRKNLVIALGASTGGTEALKEVLIRMPKDIPPIVIVQHIPPVFSTAFSKRLNELCPFEVKEAEDGDAVHENRVLIAPGGKQMKIVKKTSGLFVQVNDDAPMNRHKPSVDYLFNSVAELIGGSAIGAILTGMGADGAAGLLRMKESGALTLSQDEASCVVYGMPKAAWEMKGSMQQVSLENIAAEITRLGQLKKSA